ncbi:MAG: hypothetical protein FJ317_02405 [SAR202 cluster bacterium]|nr:hypothetical protein [SAR202 cluster bacterium]
MTSSTSSPKRIEKVSSDNIVISFDLLSNLTYMASLSSARVPRETMLRKAGELPVKTAVFFEQVNLLAQRLGLEYTKAPELVAQKAKAQNIKSLLLRFASTIASGESEQVFIREESRIEKNRYENEYARSVENLKKWTDAYAAILVSVTLIVVVGMVSNMMGSLNQTFVLIIAFVMFTIMATGVYVILRTSPYEDYTYDGPGVIPKDRARARLFLRTLGPLGLIMALAVGILGGVGLALVVFAVFLFPAGWYARKDDASIRAMDKEVALFIRSLGAVAGATRTTLGGALSKLDLRAMGNLAPFINRLETRLLSQLPSELSWERFKSESGNELLRRSTDMLVDGVLAGGRPEEIGEIASSYASTVSELRETRRLTASTFGFLVIPMHLAMTGLLLFILNIVKGFNDRLEIVSAELLQQSREISSLSPQANSFGTFAPQDLTLVTGVIIFVVLVLTVANALAPKFAAGGNNLMITWTLSISALLSGFNMIVVPKVATALLAG